MADNANQDLASDRSRQRRVAPRPILRRLGDAGAVALLAGVFIYLTRWDGGASFGGDTGIVRLSILALAVVPALVGPLFQSRGVAKWAIGMWGAGALVAFALAMSRSNFAVRAMTLGLMPLCAIAAARIASRRRGADLILALLVVSFLLYWSNAFLSWSAGGGAAMWLPLSWHNQSGILMAGFALVFAGVATQSHGRIRVPAIVLSAMGFAGAYLSSSRGATLAAIAGGSLLALAVFRRRRPRIGAIAAGVAVLLLAAILVFTLRSLYGYQDSPQVPATRPSDTAQASPIDSGPTPRRESASSTFRDRMYHWSAAAGMIISRPMTGWGLGSFPDISRRFTSPKGHPTSDPHNEYLQLLSDGGLLLGSAALIIVVALGLICLRLAWFLPHSKRSNDDAVDRARPGVQVGAAAALAALMLHASVDFDWAYPVIACFAAVMAGLLWQESCQVRSESSGDTRRRWTGFAALLPVVALLALGTSAAIAEQSPNGPPPWDARSQAGAALAESNDGSDAAALARIERARKWNPGVTDLDTTKSIILFRAGRANSGAIEEALIPGTSSFDAYTAAARALLDAQDLQGARRVIDAYFDYIGRYSRWASTATRSSAWRLRIQLEYRESGCEGARRVADTGIGENPTKEGVRRAITEEVGRLCPAQ
ncbi:MAG: hypothetical protein DCC49_01690 [Acidobacteria bacterium]|nr:MAG: hypothetical protein DCC49_01690 [Acidobacteriota bacterium]